MIRNITILILTVTAQLYSSDLRTSSDGIKILNTKDKKKSKEIFAFVNKEETSLVVRKVEMLKPETLKKSINNLNQKINCDNVTYLSIKDSTVTSLAGLNQLFACVTSLYIQNSQIQKLDLHKEGTLTTITIESNTINSLVEKEIETLKKTLGHNFIHGNNKLINL